MTVINRMLNRGVDANSNLGNFKTFPDTMDARKWYYYEIIEAYNDHEAEGARPNENWVANHMKYFYDKVKYEYPDVQ